MQRRRRERGRKQWSWANVKHVPSPNRETRLQELNVAQFEAAASNAEELAAPQGMLWRKYLPWLGLVAVLALYVTAIVRLHPTNLFGFSSDDMIYFSSAKALAEGKGYILPSIPGTPLATKHPILLPWLLSWVWRWDPSFPGNLTYAIAVIVAFGCGFVTAAFLFLRRLLGLSDAEALLLTAFCALHPMVLFYSGSILSDIPFAALALAAMLIAGRSFARNNFRGAALAGILVGLSMLVRTVGVPIAGGIALAYVFRRAWKPLGVFAMCAAPFFAVMMWRIIFLVPSIPPAMAAADLPGWQQTWLYYTNYVAFRKLVFMNTHALWPMALSQFLYLCSDVPGYFTSPLMLSNGGLALVSMLTGLWIIVSGIIHNARRWGWQPIHIALILYIALFLTWDYPDWERFLFPFLPLLAGCFWVEGKRITEKCWSELSARRSRADTLIAAGGLAAMLALVLVVCWNFAGGDRKWFRNASRVRAALQPEKQEAYDWLKLNSAKDARVIATDHAVLYLYTGRQSLEDITYLPSELYDPKQVDRDLLHVTDVAKAIGAEYWFTASDDGAQNSNSGKGVIAARLRQIESVLPELFRSSGGHVRIYGLDCIQHPENAGCESADRVLFPTAREAGAHDLDGWRAASVTGSGQTAAR
jgi:hypothetical protein